MGDDDDQDAQFVELVDSGSDAIVSKRDPPLYGIQGACVLRCQEPHNVFGQRDDWIGHVLLMLFWMVHSWVVTLMAQMEIE